MTMRSSGSTWGVAAVTALGVLIAPLQGCSDDPAAPGQDIAADATTGDAVDTVSPGDGGTTDVATGDSAGTPDTDAAADTTLDTTSDITSDTTVDAGPDTTDAGPDATALTDQERVLAVPATETWVFDGLSAPVQVVRTEGNVPHIYAANRADLAFVLGFVTARDRFFMMDLARRLGLGSLSELLGDIALESDLQARSNGARAIAEKTAATLPDELGSVFDAYAAGVNAYISRVKAGELPLPTELELAGPLLGADDAADLMKPFDRLSVAGVVVVAQYEASFETGDVGRTATRAKLDTLFAGAPFEELRRDGARKDIWEHIEPIFALASAPGAVVKQGGTPPLPPPVAPLPPAPLDAKGADTAVPADMLERLVARLDAYTDRFRRDPDVGFGSNAWAVAGSATKDGRSLLAGDGHLSLSVPSFLYQLGMDTTVFGDGDVHQLGLTVPGLPMMGLGTNGAVAWAHTQQMGDITDWYREELELDADGLPKSTKFDGKWEPVQTFEESIEVADIPLLGSEGGTRTVARWTTFDGRWIAEIEGRAAKADEELLPGESLVNLGGDLVVPSDMDNDGVITAISFDYTGLDSTGFAGAIDSMGKANNVAEFREAMRGLNAYTQNFVASDQSGSIFYSGYQGVPCRGYLDRNPDGTWADGSDPSFLLDGTRYGGFTVPMADGTNDESQGADPYRCLVPWDEYPGETDPEQGWLANSNNDPGGMGFDKDLSNDPWYIGGPYDVGIRMSTIAGELTKAVAEDSADIAKMQEIQANTRSRNGEMFAPHLAAAIANARALSESLDPLDPWQQSLADVYLADPAGMDAVEQRLVAWGEAGYRTPSAVATFYSTPLPEDADAAVATMIHTAFIGAMMRLTFDDEQLPGIWRPGGNQGRVKMLRTMLEGRAEGNPKGLASFNPETGESIFFDVLQTPEVERSDEVLLTALTEALTFLRGAPEGPGKGGFGTDDMSKWLWGLRHQAKFESILSEFLDAGSEYAFLADLFAINTDVLPLAEGIAAGDPRKGLQWFPRPGDQDAVDAGNPGYSGTGFTYGSGPVMRMVVALGGGEVEGLNIVPGGQSGLTDSPHFHDQLELWLGNQAFPMRFFVSDVVEGAMAREEYVPAP